jgi:hypothetical protein
LPAAQVAVHPFANLTNEAGHRARDRLHLTLEVQGGLFLRGDVERVLHDLVRLVVDVDDRTVRGLDEHLFAALAHAPKLRRLRRAGAQLRRYVGDCERLLQTHDLRHVRDGYGVLLSGDVERQKGVLAVAGVVVGIELIQRHA